MSGLKMDTGGGGGEKSGEGEGGVEGGWDRVSRLYYN